MTTPLERDELTALIDHHRDTLWSLRWQLSTTGEQVLKQTIQALEHYRDLCDVIDARPFQEPEPETEPALPPALTSVTQEQPV